MTSFCETQTESIEKSDVFSRLFAHTHPYLSQQPPQKCQTYLLMLTSTHFIAFWLLLHIIELCVLARILFVKNIHMYQKRMHHLWIGTSYCIWECFDIHCHSAFWSWYFFLSKTKLSFKTVTLFFCASFSLGVCVKVQLCLCGLLGEQSLFLAKISEQGENCFLKFGLDNP